MRCDGVRPSCSQCVKADRAESCDFDDRHRKSRTQILQEKLLSLEQKLRNLEDVPIQPIHPLKLYQEAPYPPVYPPDDMYNQDISTVDFPSLVFDTIAPSNFLAAFEPFEPDESASTFPVSLSDSFQPLASSSSLNPTEYRNTFESPNSTHLSLYSSPKQGEIEFPAQHCKQELMAIFMAHRHQCSFEVDPSRLYSPDGQLHPALINAIYLNACCFSQSPWFAELKTYFLAETLSAISAALERSDRLIDVASALCLVAVYQYANCRISEGYRHSFAAARLAINLGLHQISGPESSPQDVLSVVIPPARDDKELTDRISVFWQVLVVDRSWSVASGLPTALPGDQTSGKLKIETPLPRSTTPSIPFVPALRAEAVTLYERAYRISSSSLRGELFWSERQEIGQALDRFSLVVPPVFGSDSLRTQPPWIDVDVLIIHAMVNVAYVYLQRDHLGKCMSASEVCLKAAHTISFHIRQLKEADFQFLDPTISACWRTIGRLYIHLIVLSDKRNNRAREMHGVARELNVLILALKKLGKVFPIAGMILPLGYTDLMH